MNPDAPPPQPLPSGLPFHPMPEPRLGIMHLLVWTACVAGYFGVLRTFAPLSWSPELDPSLAIAVAAGVGRATALGGLVLWAARRYRRLPFPTQPGETLLVLLGISAALAFLNLPLRYSVYAGAMMPKWLAVLFSLVALVLVGVLYLVAAFRARILRWRVYFFTVPFAGVLWVLLWLSLMLAERLLGPSVTVGRTLIPVLAYSQRLLPGAALVFVAVKDARQGRQYRWTHWLGTGVGLWDALMNVLSGAWLAWSTLA